jgi:hypothetical protein
MSSLCAKCKRLDLREAVPDFVRLIAPKWTSESAGFGFWEGDLAIPWHHGMRDVAESASTCSLCALVLKGWRKSREVVVEENIRSGDFPADSPPKDLRHDILDIPAYADDSRSEIYLRLAIQEKTGVTLHEKSVGGRRRSCTFILVFNCHVTSKGILGGVR